MKHPALARVFSIVLAIMSVFMLINGSLGFGKASSSLQDSLSKYQRLEDKTAEYSALSAQLENSISYDEAYAELQSLQSAHDSDASQHRTDLATHTATRGGYTMAVQLIDDGKAELAEAKAELEKGKKELATQEEQFNQMSAAFELQKPQMQSAIETATEAAQCFDAASGYADSALAIISAKSEAEPENPAALEEPEEVPEPTADAPESEWEAYNQYQTDKANYDAYLAQKNAHDMWELEVKSAIAPDLAYMGGSASAGAEILAMLPESITGGMDTSSMDMGGLDASAIGQMSVQELAGAITAMKTGFATAAALPTTIQTSLNTAEAQITAGAQAIAAAKAQITAGEEAITKGEQQIQHQLEVIWYNLGQLDDESEELATTKERLDDEAAAIEKQLVTVDELKTLEQKQSSARIILMKEDGIKSLVNSGGDLADSATGYIADSRNAAQHKFLLLCIVNALAVAGGVMGIISILGSFEKLKSRVMLLVPTALCLACAVGADGINMYLGLGQMYTALFVAVSALIHLAVTLPKTK